MDFPKTDRKVPRYILLRGTKSLNRLFSLAVPADIPTPSNNVCWIIRIKTAGIRKLAKPFCGLYKATS